MPTKICTSCELELTACEKNFRRKKGKYKYGLYSKCRTCEDIYSKEYRIKNKDKLARKAKLHKQKLSQNGLCVQCGKTEALVSLRLCLKDHIKNICNNTLGDSSRWEELLGLLEDQKYKCALSGLPIEIGVNASIDHIIPQSKNGTHELENLQWVHKNVNQIKWTMSVEELLTFCKLILEYNESF